MPVIQKFSSTPAKTYTKGVQREQISEDKTAGAREQSLSNFVGGAVAPIAKKVADNYDYNSAQELRKELEDKSNNINGLLSKGRANNSTFGELIDSGLDIDVDAYKVSRDSRLGDIDVETYSRVVSGLRENVLQGRKSNVLSSQYERGVLAGYNAQTAAMKEKSQLEFVQMQQDFVVAQDTRDYNSFGTSIIQTKQNILGQNIVKGMKDRVQNTILKHTTSDSESKTKYISGNISSIMLNSLQAGDRQKSIDFVNNFEKIYGSQTVKINGKDEKLSSFVKDEVMEYAMKRVNQPQTGTKSNGKILVGIANGGKLSDLTNPEAIFSGKDANIAPVLVHGSRINDAIKSNKATYQQGINAISDSVYRISQTKMDSVLKAEQINAYKELEKGLRTQMEYETSNQNRLARERGLPDMDAKRRVNKDKGIITKILDDRDATLLRESTVMDLVGIDGQGGVFDDVMNSLPMSSKSDEAEFLAATRGTLSGTKKYIPTIKEIGDPIFQQQAMQLLHTPESSIKEIYTGSDNAKNLYKDLKNDVIGDLKAFGGDPRLNDLVNIQLDSLVLQNKTTSNFESIDRSDARDAIVREVKKVYQKNFIPYEATNGIDGKQTRLVSKKLLDDGMTPDEVRQMDRASLYYFSSRGGAFKDGVAGMDELEDLRIGQLYADGLIETRPSANGMVDLIFRDPQTGQERKLDRQFNLREMLDGANNNESLKEFENYRYQIPTGKL